MSLDDCRVSTVNRADRYCGRLNQRLRWRIANQFRSEPPFLLRLFIRHARANHRDHRESELVYLRTPYVETTNDNNAARRIERAAASLISLNVRENCGKSRQFSSIV